MRWVALGLALPLLTLAVFGVFSGPAKLRQQAGRGRGRWRAGDNGLGRGWAVDVRLAGQRIDAVAAGGVGIGDHPRGLAGRGEGIAQDAGLVAIAAGGGGVGDYAGSLPGQIGHPRFVELKAIAAGRAGVGCQTGGRRPVIARLLPPALAVAIVAVAFADQRRRLGGLACGQNRPGPGPNQQPQADPDPPFDHPRPVFTLDCLGHRSPLAARSRCAGSGPAVGGGSATRPAGVGRHGLARHRLADRVPEPLVNLQHTLPAPRPPPPRRITTLMADLNARGCGIARAPGFSLGLHRIFPSPPRERSNVTAGPTPVPIYRPSLTISKSTH